MHKSTLYILVLANFHTVPYYKTHSYHTIEIMPVIQLTPHQAISIYGWSQPIRILDWSIVKEHRLHFSKLLTELKIPIHELKRLQPHKKEWLKEHLVTTEDLPHLLPWKIHAFLDLEMSLAELMCNGPPSAGFLKETGVTFEQMQEKGLTSDLMRLFPYTVSDWRALGMGRNFIDTLSEVTCGQIFHMPKAVVVAAIQ